MKIIKSKEVIQQFLQVLPHDQIIKQVKTCRVNFDYNVDEQIFFEATKPLKASQEQFYTRLIEIWNSLEKNTNQKTNNEIKYLLSTLKPKYQQGDQLLKIDNVEKITFDNDYSFTKEETQLEIEQGIVYLIDIWETLSQTKYDGIGVYESMQERNAEWDGKVKIMCLSGEYATESVAEIVKLKKLKSLQHYRFVNGWDDYNPFCQNLSKTELPLVLLINKQSQIAYIGDPSKINLEQKINQLVTAEFKEEEFVNDVSQPLEQMEKNEFKALKQQVYILQKVLKQAEFEGRVQVELEKVNHWKQNGIKVVQNTPKLTLHYDIDVKEEPKLNSFLENHWNKIPENLRTLGEVKIKDSVGLMKAIQTKFQETFAALGINLSQRILISLYSTFQFIKFYQHIIKKHIHQIQLKHQN